MASERFVQIAGIIWARFNSFVTPMFVRVIGEENIDRSHSYVVVGNHQSQYDIFVVYGWLPIDFRWVMKIELRKVPIIGYYCYKAGHIFIDRSNSKSAIEIDQRGEEQDQGRHVRLLLPGGDAQRYRRSSSNSRRARSSSRSTWASRSSP